MNVEEEETYLDIEEDAEEEEEVSVKHRNRKGREEPLYEERVPARRPQAIIEENSDDMPEEEGELSVDVYQTQSEIIIEAMVAGVKPEDLHLSITRDMITIKGRRDANTQIPPDDYFYKELYWGPFARSILLPHEIEIEEAEAVEKHGLLIIRMPKIDKARQSKIKVKSI
jgi:HSP20 family molecular chaperone IbpA